MTTLTVTKPTRCSEVTSERQPSEPSVREPRFPGEKPSSYMCAPALTGCSRDRPLRHLDLVASVARCAMLSVMGSAGVVFDLFHTLVDTEHLRPVGFDAVVEVANVVGVESATFAAFWDETYVERETTMLDLVELTVRFCDGA